MDLSVVIVSYESRDRLLECLAALAADASSPPAEIVVVDNASRDGSPAAVAAAFPAARVLANGENVGYARAVNQGVAATRGAFVLVMNPDCIVKPGAVRTLVEHLLAHPATAVVGPRILNPDGSIEYSARAFPDHFTFLFNRYSLLTRLFPGNPWTRRYLLTDWDHASARAVDWVSGACMLVRRGAIERVGGMDEAFFMFNEDVDWCRRMKLAGLAVAYEPAAEVVHWIGASRTRVANRVIYERHRGMIHYFHKHHPANPVVSAVADALIMARAGLMIAANALKAR
jgi:N-acetylglucosaminyl-diphospho-decaprenol L-rhamnosyltransferase